MKRLQLVVLLLSALASGISGSVTGNCDYSFVHDDYTCDFSVHIFANENDVTAIEGTHLQGYGDSNVVRLEKASTLMLLPYVPTILCRQFPNLRYIDLYRSEMQVITINSFSGCSSLQTIDLGSNELTQIPANVFVNPQLRQLYLDDNRISDIAVGAFNSLIFLQELYLYSNQLRTIPAGLFVNNLQLSTLFLRSNQITDIAAGAFNNLVNLYMLSLANNQLTVLNADLFKELSNLSVLHVQDNAIVELPQDIFIENRYLLEIQMYNNQLTRIHPGFLDNPLIGTRYFEFDNNICIDSIVTFDENSIDEVRPLFEECFRNWNLS